MQGRIGYKDLGPDSLQGLLTFLTTRSLLLFLPVLAACCAAPLTDDERASLYERQVDGEVFDTTPVRGRLKEFGLHRGTFEFKCTECHDDFKSDPTVDTPAGEHRVIMDKFDHGLNIYCMNCHHRSERNSFIGYGTDIIPSNEPARLCSKCHGPMYHDWERGIHGRQNQHWNAEMGPRPKLQCIECHDPHRPKFESMAPDIKPAYSRLNPTEPGGR